LLSALTLAVFALAAPAAAPLKLVAKYKMPPSVKGRFDHLGADVHGNRLFLAAESAHEVLVFNLRSGKFIRAITGIGIPHAILYRPDLNRIYVTDGGAGEVRIYDGKTYRQIGSVKLNVDSDSIGYDPATHDLYVVNGGGDAHQTFSMVSVVNTTSDKKVADIKIDGDTLEQMALAPSGPLLYIENPSKSQVDVVNRQTRSVVANWPITMGHRNVAIAFDPSSHRVFVACRSGALIVLDSTTGKELQSLPIGKGVDDLIFDPASKRIYASCGGGEGTVVVYREDNSNHYTLLGKVPSGPGGKNEVLVPRLDHFFVTIPPRGGTPGEVYVYDVR
ncbi:MAG: YncE family protein, partial [Bryobacteraceae bacterium]